MTQEGRCVKCGNIVQKEGCPACGGLQYTEGDTMTLHDKLVEVIREKLKGTAYLDKDAYRDGEYYDGYVGELTDKTFGELADLILSRLEIDEERVEKIISEIGMSSDEKLSDYDKRITTALSQAKDLIKIGGGK